MFKKIWESITSYILTKRINKIKSLFPLAVEIDQEIIDKADIVNVSECIGALTLRKALGDKLLKDMSANWYNRSGRIQVKKSYMCKSFSVIINTQENIDMMEVKKPESVILIAS